MGLFSRVGLFSGDYGTFIPLYFFEYIAQSSYHGVVLAECTPLSEQYFRTLQEVATLQLRLATVPVTSQSNAATHIAQMVQQPIL